MNTKSSLRKKQILQSGFTLFSEQGFQATTMEQIATSVSVARTTLYEYFKSKEDILFSLLDEVVAEQPTKPKEGSVKEQLTFLAEVSLKRLQKNFQLYKILFQELPTLSNPAAERIRYWQEQTLVQVFEVIQYGIELGCFSKNITCKEIGFAYQALVGQKMSSLLMSNEQIDSKQEAEKLVNILWYGIHQKGEV